MTGRWTDADALRYLDARYDPDGLRREMSSRFDVVSLFPEVSVKRGGIRYPPPPTPAESAAREALAAHVNRVIAAQVALRDATIAAAVAEADRYGWDLEVHHRPPYAQMRSALTSRMDLATNSVSIPPEYVGLAYSPQKYPGAVTLTAVVRDDTDLWDDEW